MKVVVGLGNPGERYADTPHSVGFDVADVLARRMGGRWRLGARFQALTARARSGDGDLLLVKPQTFMNASGMSVASVLRYHRAEPGDLVVVLDDADLDAGRLRIRASGGSGGHRGLQSIIDAVGTGGFPRVRLGIGRDPRGGDLADHVLGRFTAGERRQMDEAVARAADAVLCVATDGVDRAMNVYNAPPVSGAADAGPKRAGAESEGGGDVEETV